MVNKIQLINPGRVDWMVMTHPLLIHPPPPFGNWAWTNQSHEGRRTQPHHQLDQTGQFLGRRCAIEPAGLDPSLYMTKLSSFSFQHQNPADTW